MIKLTGIALQNFLSFRQEEVNFDDLGLCLIQGLNKDENDDSNGSGKSTIANAICWVLFGRTIKGLTGDSVINWDVNKDCMGSLNLEIGDKQVTIQRFRKYEDIGDGIKITINGTLHEGTLTEMQWVINNLIGFDYETFTNTAVYSSNTARLLGSSTDSQRRTLFGKLLNLERFERAHEIAKNERDRLQEEKEGINHERSVIDDKIAYIKDNVKDYKRDAEDYKGKIQKEIEQYTVQIDALPKRRPIKGKKREFESLSKELGKLDSDKVERQASELLGGIRSDAKQITDLEKDLMRLPNACPMCRREFTNLQMKTKKKDIEDRLESMRDDLVKKTDKYEKLTAVVDKAQPLKTKWASLQNDLFKIEAHNRDTDHFRQNFEERISQLKKDKNENPYRDSIQKSLASILSLEKEKVARRNQLKPIETDLQEFDVLVELFGKKGISSYIIENSFDFIQDRANYYLTILAGGTFEIALESERELASGARKEEITLRIFHDGKEISYQNASDGQQQRINIALLFAINAYCRSQNNLDFLLLDEVLDLSLDETGQERVTELLREISREVGSIFVISHKQGISSNFDSVLNIRYENGESRIV